MAETQASLALSPQQWDDEYFQEFIRQNRYRRYMGKSETAMIQVKEDLTRKPGDKVTFAAARKLRGAGVTGETQLEGREDVIDTRGFTVQVDYLRNAVIVTKKQEQLSAIRVREMARPLLKSWSNERFRDDLISAFMSVDGVNWFLASAVQKNTWLQNNADRVLVGGRIANASSGNMATALLTLNASDGRLTPELISLAKRRAELAQPALQPIMTKGEDGEEEGWVLFAPSLAFRDLSQNPTMIAALKDARERGVKNPLFAGGDLIWDGVIIKKDSNIPTLGPVGAGGVEVAMSYMCGAQAIGLAWAQRPITVDEMRDYKFRHGVAIEEMRGIEKLRFGTGGASDGAIPKQAGVVTIFTAAPADL